VAQPGSQVKSEVSKLQAALPKIVVVGSQSAGKSSVLNKLAGTDAKLLAIGGGRTVTRTPIRLQLVSEEKIDGGPYVAPHLSHWRVVLALPLVQTAVMPHSHSQ